MQLSEKELLMISESLMGHLCTVEKFRNFSQACSDPEVKQLLDSHTRQMDRHCQELMNMVQGVGMSGGMGYSQYSQSPQLGSSQYGTSYGMGSQNQMGTQQGMGSHSQYGTNYGAGSQPRQKY